jgi:ribosomal protein L37AE/L43A
VAELSLEQMQQQKKASCPVCGRLNEYGHLSFGDWTKCTHCATDMIIVRIDSIVFFLRHGWT